VHLVKRSDLERNTKAGDSTRTVTDVICPSKEATTRLHIITTGAALPAARAIVGLRGADDDELLLLLLLLPLLNAQQPPCSETETKSMARHGFQQLSQQEAGTRRATWRRHTVGFFGTGTVGSPDRGDNINHRLSASCHYMVLHTAKHVSNIVLQWHADMPLSRTTASQASDPLPLDDPHPVPALSPPKSPRPTPTQTPPGRQTTTP
jgi:hypothetical protein